MRVEQKKESWEQLHNDTQLTPERTAPSPIIVDYLSRNIALETNTPIRQTKALEVGFGMGRNMMYLAEHDYCQYIVGVDMIQSALAKGRQHADERGFGDRCSFFQAVAGEPFPFEDDAFDFVFDVMSASTFISDDAARKSYASEVNRILKKGGVFFAYTGKSDGKYFACLDPQRKIGESGYFKRSMDGTMEKAYSRVEMINLFSPLVPVLMEPQSYYFRAFGEQEVHRPEGFWFAIFKKLM